jgi:hypothetical protein
VLRTKAHLVRDTARLSCDFFHVGFPRSTACSTDAVFFEPFEEFLDPEIGRPSIPTETYLRMMFLRFCYRLGFEALFPKWRTPSRGAGSVASASPTPCVRAQGFGLSRWVVSALVFVCGRAGPRWLLR